jgi:6-phosphogluconolactonase (cycloisomerase 2 family)
MYDPKEGKKVVAAAKKNGGVNHSCNDASTIQQRQADPHSHALVLDPFVGTIAYVPDLGKDLIREFLYDPTQGKIVCELNMLPSGLCTGHPDGPRYIEFHPEYNIAYVVNELSSTVAVFEIDRTLLQEIDAANRHNASIVADDTNTSSSNNNDNDKTPIDMNKFRGRSSLRLIQSISTLPSAFPNSMNTCGRICVHPSGRFVVVSNRGHQSVCVYKVKRSSSNNNKSGISSNPSKRGQLQVVGHFHTRGETPRHFQFDHSGQYLLVANQDTDSLAVFSFNLSNGQVKYTGNEYRVPSPNFVCCCPTYQQDDDEVDSGIAAGVVATSAPVTSVNTSTTALVAETKLGAEPLLKVLEVPPSSVDVVYHGHSMLMDSGDTSDSDDSTIRTNRVPRGHGKKSVVDGNAIGTDAGSSLEEQLKKAQMEIEQLRALLMQSRVESN